MKENPPYRCGWELLLMALIAVGMVLTMLFGLPIR